jgi:hypothetical protein
MSKKSVIKFYEAVVGSLLAYASEMRPDTSMTKKMMETTGIKTLRKMVGENKVWPHQKPRY